MNLYFIFFLSESPSLSSLFISVHASMAVTNWEGYEDAGVCEGLRTLY